MSELALRTAATPLRPLRIALLGYRSNPYSGGQGIYLKYLSAALADAGHQVDVISGEPYPELDPRVRLVKLPGLNLYAEKNHVTALRPRHLEQPESRERLANLRMHSSVLDLIKLRSRA